MALDALSPVLVSQSFMSGNRLWPYPRKTKYGSVRQTYKGQSFHSRAEAKYAFELDLRKRAGEITKWESQIRIPFVINGIKICTYICDFLLYHADGSKELVEIKGRGIVTDLFRIKERLLRATYLKEHPEIRYTIIYV